MERVAYAMSTSTGRYAVTYNDSESGDIGVSRDFLETLAVKGYRVEGVDEDGRPFSIAPWAADAD